MPTNNITMSSLFTRDDCFRCADISHTHKCGYSPIALMRPNERSVWQGGVPELNISGPFDLLSLKLYYALQVWQMALSLITEETRRASGTTYDDWSYEWIPLTDSFNRLVSKSKDYGSTLSHFWDTLKSICDRHLVRVTDGSFFDCTFSLKMLSWDATHIGPRLHIVLDSDEFSAALKLKNFDSLFLTDRHSFKPVSYDWNEISGYFTEVSFKELELMHGEKINRHTEKDDALFRACHALNTVQMEAALHDGAHILALNEDGRSPIAECMEAGIETLNWINDDHGLSPQERKVFLKRLKECISFLLKQGADINSYGFGCCCTPLYNAVFIHEPEIMEYLFENGADPNLFDDYFDLCSSKFDWHIKSSCYDCLLSEFSLYGETPELLRKEELMKQYHAQVFIDGFEPETWIREKS